MPKKRLTQTQVNKADSQMDKKLGIKPGSKLDRKIDKLDGAKPPKKGSKS